MKRNILLIYVLVCMVSCSNNNTQVFRLLDNKETGIHFSNQIVENDSINILDLEYVYNGGGVAIADFNNDGLQDVYLTANISGNQLYLNQGGMHFKDVTGISNVSGKGRWSTGVATVDINNDGLMDIYVCTSVKTNPGDRANLLYINKGVGKDGVPVFEDQAIDYHVADTGHTTNAAFFDYDNDGDLDLYLLTNKMEKDHYPNQYRKKIKDGSASNTDRLYRNDWNDSLHRRLFTDVSKMAGIKIEGYGLGLNITDINKDGWKDVYVTNDFLTNDLLWINNANGTFTDMADRYFKHTSYSAMGNDVADINNDGLMDIIAVDMLPHSNFRKKMMVAANNYQNTINNEEFGYGYQYGRNTLQLNQGTFITNTDSVSNPVFSEIGFFAGIAETDWSWTPMVVDFDNDGFRDILITNGFPKDITDRDFMSYRVDASKIASKTDILEQIPEVKLHNFAFKNNSDCTFSEVSKSWGMTEPSFSSGAAYGDLDNDGDMDYVVNNTNGEAMVYQNEVHHGDTDDHNYLQIKFKGDSLNVNGIGTWVELYYDKGRKQVYEHTPYRGYLSSIQPVAHFGLNHVKIIDSVVIKWPNQNMQILVNVTANQVIEVNHKNATNSYKFDSKAVSNTAIFVDLSDSMDIPYKHQELDFSDFNIQRLLPHKLSEYGPALSAADVDGNGLDDLVLGGSYSYSAKLLLQQSNGKFTVQDLLKGASTLSKRSEDMGVLLFDADADMDPDLYIASGSYESEPNSISYRDMFFKNDGKGNFAKDSLALPQNFASKSCVRAVDFDKDGDLDLFVAGRVEPWSYPKPVSSFIYRNDSKGSLVKFTDVTSSIAKDLHNIGLICDALWTDFDNDGWQDLVLAGEWMPVTFLKNNQGVFQNISAMTGVNNKIGLWNSITPGDFDNDGDVDYAIGNMGLNSFYRASEKYPVRIYAKDFDNNKSYDAIPSLYLTDQDGNKKEYPAQTRDDLVKQIISMRAKFQNYNKFATATIDKVLTTEELKGALIVETNTLATSFFKNNGNGKFAITTLPAQAQFSAVNGMITEDVDADGNLDIIINGNDYGTEVSVGRYDAFNGLLLKGGGNGSFKAASILESGIYIPGNGKALVKLRDSKGQYMIIASQNRGALKVFKPRVNFTNIPLLPLDVSASIKFKNGKSRKQEIYYGSSFLSQSARFLRIDPGFSDVTITNSRGETRKILF